MNEQQDLFSGYGVRIKLADDQAFLKIKETLTRIGIASKKDKTIYQSCHILHKRGEYAILHFKELFALDGKGADITQDDVSRRDSIVKLLEEWKLLSIVDDSNLSVRPDAMSQIKVISHKEKESWVLVPKYTIGKSKKQEG